jgi:hypothetical protein
VALSRFTVANGMEAEVRHAFVDRPRLVERAAPKGLKLAPKATRMRYFEHACS